MAPLLVVGRHLRAVTHNVSHDRLARPAPQLANKFLLKRAPIRGFAAFEGAGRPGRARGPNGPAGGLAAHDPTCLAPGSGQLQIVTYTGGRNREGGTPSAGERIKCIASGVPRKRRNALALALRCWRSSMLTCQRASTGRPGTSTRESSPRRNCWATRCSTAGATPPPSAAAAHAAVWLGNTLTLLSGMPSMARSCPVPVPGSVPDGSTSQRHWRGLPRGVDCPAATTTRRYRKIGSVTSASARSSVTLGLIATSASRLATSTPISLVTATPTDTSTEPA